MITMREIDDAIPISSRGEGDEFERGKLGKRCSVTPTRNDKSATSSRCIHPSANHWLPENRRGWRPNADLMKYNSTAPPNDRALGMRDKHSVDVNIIERFFEKRPFKFLCSRTCVCVCVTPSSRRAWRIHSVISV